MAQASTEERSAEEDHSHRQSPSHSRSESGDQDRDQEPIDEYAQYPEPYVGGSSEGLLARVTPESCLGFEPYLEKPRFAAELQHPATIGLARDCCS